MCVIRTPLKEPKSGYPNWLRDKRHWEQEAAKPVRPLSYAYGEDDGTCISKAGLTYLRVVLSISRPMRRLHLILEIHTRELCGSDIFVTVSLTGAALSRMMSAD